jgi:hypothetical protein
MNLPGFTAAASLERNAHFASHRFGAAPTEEDSVQPAQTFEIWRSPWWLRNDIGNLYFRSLETVRQLPCMRECYRVCLQKYPGLEQQCSVIAEDCCVNDYHCSYCNRW